MAIKIAAALLLLLLRVVPLRAELLKVNLLEKPAAQFTLKIDIFSGSRSAGGDSQAGDQKEIPQAQAEAAQKTIAEEIYQSIIYEGYVSKNAKKSALLNVSGEFFMVNEGDVILQKLKILKISRETVTVEYENLPYDITLKGDENG